MDENQDTLDLNSESGLRNLNNTDFNNPKARINR